MIHSRSLLASLVAINLLLAGGLSYFSQTNIVREGVPATPVAATDDASDLILLSEAQVDTPEPVIEDDPVTRECRVWGPRSEIGAFDDLTRILDRTGGFPEIVEVEIDAAPTYMVYVDVRDASVQARRVMQELKAVEIDNFRIRRDDGDIISVGVFSKLSLAEKQLQRVQELGYQTELETMERSQTVFTLHGYVDPSSSLYAESSHKCDNSENLQVSSY